MSEDTATSGEEIASGTGFDPVDYVPMAGIAALYVVTVLGAMAVVDEAAAAGMVAFEDSGSVGNVGRLGVGVVAFTAVTIAAKRLGYGMQLIRLYLVAVFAVAAGHVVVLVGIGSHSTAIPYNPITLSPVPLVAAAVTGVVLWVHPEWYVIDVLAVAAGVFIIPMLGLGLEPAMIVALLVVWAAYDAYSVYVSGHMKELAGAIGELKVPIMYVVPGSLDFSMRDLEETDVGSGDGEGSGEDEPETGDDGPSVNMLGLGDSVFPGILAVSAGQFLDAPVVVEPLNANLPALGAFFGGVVGLVALLVVVHRFEGTHAGHPPLNAGVIGGYLVGALLAGVPLTVALGL